MSIPQLGFGVYQVPPEDTKKATLTALEVGYRHIDTAQMYGNEKGVGEAVRESGLDRSDVFVTSKLNNGHHAHDDALAGVRRDARGTRLRLRRPVLDPLAAARHRRRLRRDVEGAWRRSTAAAAAKAIGVSNFQSNHLRRLVQETEIVPAVNQIEVHPYLTNDDVRAVNTELGIATEAWSPIAQGLVLDDPVITGIAKDHDRTPAQVVLRWHVQRGDIVFPKSVTRSRVEENFALFDFELSDLRHGTHHGAQQEISAPDPTPTSSTGSPERHAHRLSQTVTPSGARGIRFGP